MSLRPIPSSVPLLLLTAALLHGCHEEAAPPAKSDGQGLLLQAYEGPLARGVEKRDPRLEFYDFGRVRDGDTVHHVFQMKNTDPRPVSVTRVDPGCGCTVASLRAVRLDGTVEQGLPIHSKSEKLLTVAPGETAELEVRIATREIVNKNNHKLVTIRVLTDSPNRYFLNLEVHVFVERPFEVVPGVLALGRIPENGGGHGKVEIVQAGGFAYELKEVLPPPEGIVAELTKEIRLEHAVWVLEARMLAPLERGSKSATLRIATEEKPGVPGLELEVPLTGQVVEDIATEPERLVFSAPRDVPARGSCELLSLLEGQRLRVTGIEVPADQRAFLSVRYEPVEADDGGTSLRWRVTLETIAPLPADRELVAGKLLVHLDDPQHPSYLLEYVVHLK